MSMLQKQSDSHQSHVPGVRDGGRGAGAAQPLVERGDAHGNPDSDLVRRIARGEPVALIDLYDRYCSQAMGLAFSRVQDLRVAERIVNDAFLTVWRSALCFDPNKGAVDTWVLAIVVQHANQHLRTQSGPETSIVKS